MKYAVAGLAIVAAVAALFVRPPQIGVPRATATSAPAGERITTAQTGPVAAGVPGSAVAVGAPSPRGERAASVVVYVAGAVRAPGVYTLPARSRAVDALARAGGALPGADLVAVNLAALVGDGDEIAVATIGAQPPVRRGARNHRATRQSDPARHHRRRRRSDSPATAPLARIDLNTADAVALERIPGIGPTLAQRIVAYRETNGRFASIDELGDVAGITPRLQDDLVRYAVVAP